MAKVIVELVVDVPQAETSRDAMSFLDNAKYQVVYEDLDGVGHNPEPQFRGYREYR